MFDELKDYLISIVFTIIGASISGLYIYFKNRRQWFLRESYQIIHASLNTIISKSTAGEDQPFLTLDTIFEEPAEKIIPNPYAVKLIQSAASKTTPEDPFIYIKNEDDRWLVLNQLRLAIAETNHPGTWQKAMGA